MCGGGWRAKEWWVDRQVKDRQTEDWQFLLWTNSRTNSSTNRAFLNPSIPFYVQNILLLQLLLYPFLQWTQLLACHLLQEDLRDSCSWDTGRCSESCDSRGLGAPPAVCSASWQLPTHTGLSPVCEPQEDVPGFGHSWATDLSVKRREELVKEVKSLYLKFW